MAKNPHFIRRACWLQVFSALTISSAFAADLTVEVTGHDASGGKVRVALYNDSNSFLRTSLRGIEGPATQGPVLLTFKDIPPGAYAMSAYQDDNGNEKLDRGMFRVPTERYGFSRDARGDKGPPEFRDAQLDVRDAAVKASIKLR